MKNFFFVFQLNGEYYNILTTKVITIKELIEFFKFQEKEILIEHNGKIYNPMLKQNYYLQNGDEIEIITIVGGG